MKATPAALESANVGYNARYQAAYDRTPSWWDRIATEVPSSTTEERYHWMKDITGMREWISERVVDNLAASAYTLVNKKWEKTIGLKQDEIEDDKLGIFSLKVDALAAVAKRWPDELVYQALVRGLTELCYDGQYFFDTDHPNDPDDAASLTYSNKHALGLSAVNYDTVRKTMRNIKGSNGRPLAINPNLLVVSSANETMAKSILQNDLLINAAGTATGNNPYKGTADLLVIPEGADDELRWYLFDTTKAIKPLVFQLRKAIAGIVALTSPTDRNVFMNGEYLYGIDGRANAGFSLPFLAATSKP